MSSYKIYSNLNKFKAFITGHKLPKKIVFTLRENEELYDIDIDAQIINNDELVNAQFHCIGSFPNDVELFATDADNAEYLTDNSIFWSITIPEEVEKNTVNDGE